MTHNPTAMALVVACEELKDLVEGVRVLADAGPDLPPLVWSQALVETRRLYAKYSGCLCR
jgi:hypothetical protein